MNADDRMKRTDAGRGAPGRRTLLICLLSVGLAASGPAAAGENIRVTLAERTPKALFRSASGFVVNGGGRNGVYHRLDLLAEEAGTGPIRLRPLGAHISLNGRPYRGTLEVRKQGAGGLQVINEVDLEDYLKGVVASEVPHEWHEETLKAQAVASRTFALYQKQAAGDRGYHLSATVNSQVYLGVRGEHSRASRAVEATRGTVLRSNGGVIAAFYHSSCGGHTEDARELWGIDAAYLRGVDCDCQRISKYGVWEKRFPLPAVLKVLRREGHAAEDVSSVASGDLTAAGRMKSVMFHSNRGMIAVPSETLRAGLGNGNVPSVFFEPGLIGREFVLSGRGLGHGVGMCQWGAQERAGRGWGYRDILRHYYPGVEVGK